MSNVQKSVTKGSILSNSSKSSTENKFGATNVAQLFAFMRLVLELELTNAMSCKIHSTKSLDCRGSEFTICMQSLAQAHFSNAFISTEFSSGTGRDR